MGRASPHLIVVSLHPHRSVITLIRLPFFIQTHYLFCNQLSLNEKTNYNLTILKVKK